MKKNIYSFFKYQIFILMLLVIPFMSSSANFYIAEKGQMVTLEGYESYTYTKDNQEKTTYYYYLKALQEGVPAENVYCYEAGVNIPNGEQIFYTASNTMTKFTNQNDPNERAVCAVIKYAQQKQKIGSSSTTVNLINWNNISGIDYLEVQKTIWDALYKYDSNTPQCGADEKVKYKEDTYDGNLTMNSSDLSFTKSGDNYVSSKINVSHAHLIGNYNINLTGAQGAYAVEEIGKEAITSSTANGFYIVIPEKNVTGDVSVSVTISGEVLRSQEFYYRPYIVEYTPDKVSQKVAMVANRTLDTVETKETLSKTLDFSINTATLTIIKKDVETEKTIEGVSFTLLDRDGKVAKKADGTEVGLLKTNSEGKIIVDNLLFGDYKLKEMGVPDGYILNSEELPIVIDADAEEVIVTNVPVDITKISKVDSVTGKALVGAELKVLDYFGEELFKFTSTEEVFEVYLSPGIHYIEEVTAPEGYDKLNVVYEFEVTEQGDIVALSESDYFELKNGIIYVYNTPTPEEVVEVPDTGGNMNLYLIIGGGMLLGGISVIAVILNKRKKAVNQI